MQGSEVRERMSKGSYIVRELEEKEKEEEKRNDKLLRYN